MNSSQLDTSLGRWLHKQPDWAGSSYHVQIKLWSSEVQMAQLTAPDLTGWVVIDWQHRGRGLSAKRAHPVGADIPNVARLLDVIEATLLHINLQVILAPNDDWPNAYSPTSLVPDLMPVLDAEHATVLSITAERDRGDWRVVQAHEPPSDERIDDFLLAIDG
jgi:hypothetical protein